MKPILLFILLYYESKIFFHIIKRILVVAKCTGSQGHFSLHEKCPYFEFFWSVFLRIWRIFTQCFSLIFFRLNQCLSKSMSLPVWLLEENTSCSFSDRIDLFAREIKWGCILWIFVIKQKMKLWSNTRCYYYLPLTTGTS